MIIRCIDVILNLQDIQDSRPEEIRLICEK